MLQQTFTTCASWLREVREAHAALHDYGLHRLEPVGWRELGIGALVAAGPAFRYFALDAAADWAATELRGPSGETFAESAQRPAGFAPHLHRALHALGRSRLGVFRVARTHGTPPRLLDLRTRVHVTLAGLVRPHLVLPPGATVIARLAASPRGEVAGALLVSSTVIDAAAPPVADCSRALLRHLLTAAAALDATEEALLLQPRLLGVRPDALAQLDQAMLALQQQLALERGARVQWRVDDGELLCERHGVGWRVTLRGGNVASVERVPATVAHPFDVELMRQVGVEQYVWEVDGDVAALTRACSHSSTRSRSAA